MSAAAIRFGHRIGLIHELGELTFAELDVRSNRLANAWRERGLRPGEGVAILARNHRWFLDSVLAAAKCGAKIVLLNTDFAGPQIREVADREGTDLLVHDDEYAQVLGGVRARRRDDRLRGRERIPGRGRGAAQPPRGDCRGGGDRGPRRPIRPAPSSSQSCRAIRAGRCSRGSSRRSPSSSASGSENGWLLPAIVEPHLRARTSDRFRAGFARVADRVRGGGARRPADRVRVRSANLGWCAEMTDRALPT